MPTIAEVPSEEIPEDVRHNIARETMMAHFQILRAKGKHRSAQTPEQFYRFRPEDVVEIHFHKHGFGRGVWYRLKDGRVINAVGNPSQPDRSWYVCSKH
jgi:hypothetical protein